MTFLPPAFLQTWILIKAFKWRPPETHSDWPTQQPARTALTALRSRFLSAVSRHPDILEEIAGRRKARPLVCFTLVIVILCCWLRRRHLSGLNGVLIQKKRGYFFERKESCLLKWRYSEAAIKRNLTNAAVKSGSFSSPPEHRTPSSPPTLTRQGVNGLVVNATVIFTSPDGVAKQICCVS